MHIYIDESGAFIPLNAQKSRFSALGALAIPSASHDEIVNRFGELRDTWGLSETEPKGAQLRPAQVDQTIALLSEYDVIFEAIAIDTGLHMDVEVTQMKFDQADKLLEFVTREHHPNIVQQLWSLRDIMVGLPNQLFTQVFLIIELIDRVLQTTTMYYAQRFPTELGQFVWVVDAKDVSVTPSEDLWRSVILPVIQTKSLTEPHPMVEWGDYTHFDASYHVGAAEFLKALRAISPEIASKRRRRQGGIDIKKILRENFTFGDSRDYTGLQLVDILTSAVTRAMNGSMLPSGWRHLGRLMVRRPHQSVHLASFNAEAAERSRIGVNSETQAAILRRIDQETKPMLKVPKGFRPKYR